MFSLTTAQWSRGKILALGSLNQFARDPGFNSQLGPFCNVSLGSQTTRFAETHQRGSNNQFIQPVATGGVYETPSLTHFIMAAGLYADSLNSRCCIWLHVCNYCVA